jgi:hypothetical protein
MKTLSLLLFIISFFTLGLIEVQAQPKECPVLSELEEKSIKDRKEVIEALNSLIPKTYGTGIDDFPDIYTQWNIVTAKLFLIQLEMKKKKTILEWRKPFVARKLLKGRGLYV